jgi:hypothetical protein
MKFWVPLFILLQISGIMKGIMKQAPKSSGKVIQSTAKGLKSGKVLSKAGSALVADELINVVKQADSEIMTIDDFGAVVSKEKNLNKVVASGTKNKKNIKNSIANKEEKIEDKIQDAISDLIFEDLNRSNLLWEFSMHELMLSPNWELVTSYIKINYQINVERKIDFYLLMNETVIENKKLSKKDISKVLSRCSRAYRTRAIEVLIIELKEYEPIIEKLQYFADKYQLNSKKVRKKSK